MSTTARIVQTEDVLHGKPRIEGTRIGVFSLGVAAREHETSVDEFPSLDREQIEVALAYYDDHPDLMECIRARKQIRKRSAVGQSQAIDAGEDIDA